MADTEPNWDGYGSCVGTFGQRFRLYAGCAPLAYRAATKSSTAGVA